RHALGEAIGARDQMIGRAAHESVEQTLDGPSGPSDVGAVIGKNELAPEKAKSLEPRHSERGDPGEVKVYRLGVAFPEETERAPQSQRRHGDGLRHPEWRH